MNIPTDFDPEELNPLVVNGGVFPHKDGEYAC